MKHEFKNTMTYLEAMEEVDKGIVVRRLPWSPHLTLQKISYYSPNLEPLSIVARVFKDPGSDTKYKYTDINEWSEQNIIAHKNTVDWACVTDKT